ncbi:MAG: hypothetical protein ACLGPM_12190 [Acidobacteriota bacterium]
MKVPTLFGSGALTFVRSLTQQQNFDPKHAASISRILTFAFDRLVFFYDDCFACAWSRS